MKKSIVLLASLFLSISSCVSHSSNPIQSQEDKKLQAKFRGVEGFVLRLDAAEPKDAVMIVSERGTRFASPGSLDLKKIVHLAIGNFVVPQSIRVTWRSGDYRYEFQGVWGGGTVIGDYTVPVAERIPDHILDYIRKNGGALRIKIRLKNDGVLIGWDVEERFTTPYGRGLRYVLPGGDFKEATIFNGKVVDPGWQK